MALTDGSPYKSIAATITEELHASAQPKLPPPPSSALSARLRTGADWAAGQSIQQQRDQASADLNVIRRNRISSPFNRFERGIAAPEDVTGFARNYATTPEARMRAQQEYAQRQFLSTPGTVGPTRGQYTAQPSGIDVSPHMTDLEAAAALANEPFRIGGELAGKVINPITNPVINALPENVGPVPVAGPAEAVRNFGVTTLPYLTPGTAQLGFAGLGLNVAATIEAYKDGKIDNPGLSKQLALQIGPIAASILSHHVIAGGRAGATEIANWLRTPEGADVVRTARTRAGEPGFEHPGALPEIPQTREGATAGALDEVARARAEARSMPPGELQRLAQRQGLMQTHEQLAIDRGEMLPGGVPGEFPRPMGVTYGERGGPLRALTPGEALPANVTPIRPEAPKIYHGAPGAVHEFAVKPDAYIPSVNERLTDAQTPNIVRAVRSLSEDVRSDVNLQDFLARPTEYSYAELAESLQLAGASRAEVQSVMHATGVDGLSFPANKAQSAIDERTGQPFTGNNIVIFNPDVAASGTMKIDVNKAGTGEGSDLYGPGFYTTDNPDIAHFYATHTFDAQGSVTGVRPLNAPAAPSRFPPNLAAGERGAVGKPPPPEEPQQPGMFGETPPPEKKPPAFGEGVPQGPAAEPPPLTLQAPPAAPGAAPLFDTAPAAPETLPPATAAPAATEPVARNAEINLSRFDTGQRFARVTLDKIRTDPREFQARNVEGAGTFTESRVNDIVKNYDPELMTPLIVAPDPQNPGGFVLLAGHHRLEALRRLGLPADIQIADVNIGTAEGLAKARSIADASNLTQHGTTIGERIRAIDRAGTDDIGKLRSMFPALNDQQLRDAVYVRELPGHVVERLDKLPENSPVTGIAAEVGYGKKAYGYSEQEAEGIFNRLTKTGKGNKQLTRTAARETVDKFGALFEQRKQAGMFEGNADVFGASNRVLDAMDQYARLTRDIETGIRTLTKELKVVEKYRAQGAPEAPKVTAAKAKLTELEAKRDQLATDVLGGLKDAEPAGNEAANLSATSTAEALGKERTISAETPATGTQPPSEIPSTTSEPPSGLTTRNMPPPGALEGGTISENIAPTVPPEAAPPAPAAEAPPAGAPPRVPPPPPTSGLPPPPAEPPTTAPAPPPSTPPPPASSVGNKFAAPLRSIQDVIGEVKTKGGIVGRALQNVVNPSLREGAVAKILTAYERQKISADELANIAIQASHDVYAEPYTGRNATFHIGMDGKVSNVNAPAGKSVQWQDVFSRPGDYALSAKQRAFISDFQQVIREVETLRQEAGLPALSKQGPDGWFYIPRKVEGIRGVELRRPTNPALQRVHDLAEEGVAQGIDYSNNPRATLDLHVRAAYREIAAKQLSDALEPLSLTPSDLVPAGLRAEAEKSGRNLASAQEAVLALQRARRGEQIPTSTIDMIEKVFPQLENRVQDATGITLNDLYKMSDRATATGERVYKPVTPKFLRDIKKEIGDLEDFVVDNPNNKQAAIRLRELRQQQGFARYRFGIEQDFRESSGMGLGDMLENEETWTRIPRSTRTIVRENPRVGRTDYGNAVETTQGQMLKDMISEIRGVPYTDVTSTGNAVTRYRGGYMEAMRKNVADVRSRYSQAIKAARNTEVVSTAREISRNVPGNIKEKMATIREKGVPPKTTVGELWGANQGEENIPIAQWRNRFFRREDADLLRKNLGPQGLGGPWDYIGRGAEITGNYVRFLATGGDFAAPVTHGIPTFGYRPDYWARAAWSHFQAMLDPTVQARMLRDHLQTAQEMARYGVPAGDTEFFNAIKEGGGVSILKPLEAVPGGTRARETARLAGRQTYGRSSVSYSNFLGAARIMLWENMRHMAPADRAQIIRNMTGGLDSAALGVGRRARQFESTWLAFAPKLLRSTVAFLAEARNPFSPTGRVAARSIAGFSAGIVATYVAAGLAMGRSQEEIRHGLNPLAGKKFLAYNVNGDWIGVGGSIRALVQLAGKIATNPQSLLAPDMQDNPLAAFYVSRGAPGQLEAQLLKEGLDSPPDMFKHLGTSSLPFVLQSVVEGQGPAGIIAQELGARTSRETAFEHLTGTRDEAARKAGYQDYQDAVDKLGPNAAAQLARTSPEVTAAEKAQPETPLRKVSNDTAKEQAKLDQQLESGALTPSQWRDQGKLLQANQAGRLAIEKKRLGLTDKPTGDSVLDGFYNVFSQYTNPDTGFVADPDGLQNALDKYTATLTPEEQAHLDANTGLSATATPKLAEYRADVKKLAASGYFDIEDKGYASDIWQQRFKAAGFTAAPNYQSMSQLRAAYIKARSTPGDPISVKDAETTFDRFGVVRQFERAATQARLNWFRNSPDFLALATKWGFNQLSQREKQILQEAQPAQR